MLRVLEDQYGKMCLPDIGNSMKNNVIIASNSGHSVDQWLLTVTVRETKPFSCTSSSRTDSVRAAGEV